MTRISMSLPKEILNEFDDVLKDRGYQSRSKGIRDALNDYILRQKMMDDEGEQIGIMTVIYDYQIAGLIQNLTDIQHDFHEHLNGVLRINIGEKNKLDIITVHGNANDINKMTEKIMQLEGVENVELTSLA